MCGARASTMLAASEVAAAAAPAPPPCPTTAPLSAAAARCLKACAMAWWWGRPLTCRETGQGSILLMTAMAPSTSSCRVEEMYSRTSPSLERHCVVIRVRVCMSV